MNFYPYIFFFQQFTNYMLNVKLYFASPLFIFFLSLSGIITGVNPCVISILPILFTTSNLNNPKPIDIVAFVFGLFVTQLVFCFIFFVIGYRYYIISATVPFLSAISYIIIGLVILQILYINLGVISLSFDLLNISNGIIKNYILGSLFTLNILPCVLPVMLTVVNVLFFIDNYVLLLGYSLIYCIGYISPIVFFYSIIQKMQTIQVFNVFITGKLYTILGGFFMLSLGVLKLLRILFYKY